MAKIGKCLCHSLFWLVAIAAGFAAFLFWAYDVKSDGTLYLDNAPGNAAITRELDTGIAHIRGDTWNAAVYAQGFSHAQTRLW